MDEIIDFFENKKILILGYGREGKSTHRFLLDNKVNCDIFVSDKKNVEDELIDNSVSLVPTENYLCDLDSYDIIMKSPGVCLKDYDLSLIKDRIYSQAKLILRFYRDHIIGITGTKGKSTTSTLIYEIMKSETDNVFICGNIGKPFFDIMGLLNDESVVVCELSSHQLSEVDVSPHIAVITNIYEEHLDYYKDFNEYIDKKMNIIRYQNDEDYCIINHDNINIMNVISNINVRSKIAYLSDDNETMFHMKHNKIYYNDICLFDENNIRYIAGKHNLYNIMVGFCVAKITNISKKKVINVVSQFKGLPHRMEYVGKYNDIEFYNDSISTIPQTTILALQSLSNVATLIIGGLDRGVDYSLLINYLNENRNIKVICMNDTGKKIYQKIENEKYLIDNMKEVVEKAFEITRKNTICLFSPGAASYGFYKNFEERGNIFKKSIEMFHMKHFN